MAAAQEIPQPGDGQPATPPATIVEPVADAPVIPQPEAGLLSATEPTPTPVAEPDAPAPAVEPPVEPAAPEPPTPTEPIVYSEFNFPEGVAADAERLSEFTALARESRLPQEQAQRLIDMHIGEVKRITESLMAEQHRIFAETRRGWREEITGDEQLGGAALQSNITAARRVIEDFVPPNRAEQFEEMMRVTGVVDHPEFMRFLVHLSKKLGAPPVPVVPRNPAPDRGQARPRLRDLHNHPTSPHLQG